MRNPFQFLANTILGSVSQDMGIDLGTANTLVALAGRGVIIDEPTVVAIDKDSSKTLAIGEAAKKMVGRTPASVVAIRPLRDGVISDADTTKRMLQYFIRQAHPNSWYANPRPRVVIGIPSAATEVEKRAVRQAAYESGAREAFTIEEPLAAAIGCNLPVTEPGGTMCVDIGGGTAEAAVISLGEMVVSSSTNAAGDAGSAGWMAVILLLALLFLDPEVRAKPKKIIDGLSKAGILISTLYLMFLAVSIIDFCLNFTGLPTFLSLDVLQWLQSLNLGKGGPLVFQLVALFLTMFIAILLGMGMPAVPAYINVALLMGPVLAGLGIATFTAHMFIFYFAVASAITPPVALAAFAASSITNAGPMNTAFSAVRSGIVMFIIPFVFALYPEILLIEESMIEAGTNSGAITYLPGYDGTIDIKALGLLLFRLVIALYLLSSALARYDSGPMGIIEVVLRIGLAILLLFKAPVVFGLALVGAVVVIGGHKFLNGRKLAA